MDTRIEHRKKDFKKTFEDSRRRREEQQVQIRKSQREERYTKRRQQAAEETFELGGGGAASGSSPTGGFGGAAGGGGGAASNLPLVPHEIASSVRQAVERMRSLSQTEIVTGTFELRRLLSVQSQPPIAEVIAAGAVPRLVALLNEDGMPGVQFDAAWSLTNIASGDNDQTQRVVESGAIPVFARLLRSSSSPEVREQSAWALGNISGDCPHFRDLVLSSDVLSAMIRELRSAMGNCQRKSVLINCCWALSNFCRGKPRPPFDVIDQCIPVLREILLAESAHSCPDVVADACWALSYVTDGSDERSFAAIDAVIATGVAPKLVELMGSSISVVQTPALRVVGNIVSGSEKQTQAMIEAGCIPALRPLLLNPRKVIRKETCWTVSNITAGTQTQIGEIIKGEILQDILAMLPNADPEVQGEAWWAIANAASGASPSQVGALMNMGCMKELANILHCQTAEKKLQCVVLEALENTFHAGTTFGATTNPYVFLLEEANGYPALERLQFLPEGEKARDLAVQLIRKFMQFDECTGTAYDYTAGGGGGATTAAAGRAEDEQEAFDFQGFSMQ